MHNIDMNLVQSSLKSDFLSNPLGFLGLKWLHCDFGFFSIPSQFYKMFRLSAVLGLAAALVL